MKLTSALIDSRVNGKMIAVIAARIESSTLNRIHQWADITTSDDPRIEARSIVQERTDELSDAEFEILEQILES